MYENNMLECPNIYQNPDGSYGRTEVTTLQYAGCLLKIHRRVVGSKVRYEAFADFYGDEEAANRFDHEMYYENNIMSDGGALSGEDGDVHVECDYNPRDIIEAYLGKPHSVSLEVKN